MRPNLPRSCYRKKSATRVLAGNQADIGSKVASVFETKWITPQSEENGGRQDSQSGKVQEPLAERVCLDKLGNRQIKVFPFLVESGELVIHGAERLHEKR